MLPSREQRSRSIGQPGTIAHGRRSRIKVLHVSPYFHPAYIYGGPIQSVYQLCLRTAALGGFVRVLTTDANGPTHSLDVPTDQDVQLAPGLRVRYCPRQGRHSLSPELLKVLPAAIRGADVVHLTAVYSFPTIPTLLLSRLLGRPVVWSPRGSLQRWPGSTRIREKAIWEQVCRAVAPARLCLHFTSAEEAHASAARIAGVSTAVIPNGVEIPNTAAHQPGYGQLRLLWLGRLHPIKAVDRLLEACAAVERTGDGTWSLTIAGDGDPAYVRGLKSWVAERQLGARIRFVGAVTGGAKERLFAESDVLVLPSHSENFGMVVAEALARQVPVIASRGAPWQRVEEAGCGLWVDNHPESLANAIRRIAQLPRLEMGARGRAWMQREFSWETVAQEMLRVYGALMG